MTLPNLTTRPERFSVCRFAPDEPLPTWVNSLPFWSATRTADELSLVLPEDNAPGHVLVENGWRMIQVQGPIEFSLTGILSGILAPLAQAGISIFALSTYDTDYILIKNEQFATALKTLRAAGYQIDI